MTKARRKKPFDPLAEIGEVPVGNAKAAFAFYERVWRATRGHPPEEVVEQLMENIGDDYPAYAKLLEEFHEGK